MLTSNVSVVLYRAGEIEQDVQHESPEEVFSVIDSYIRHAESWSQGCA